MLSHGFVSANAQSDTLFRIEVTATAGPLVSYFYEPRYPDGQKNTSTGFAWSIRTMWHPDHLIAFGIMSGYMRIVEDEFDVSSPANQSGARHAAARLNAIPLQVAVSMQNEVCELGVGIGPYLLLSTIEYGKTAQSSRFELGHTLFALYKIHIGKTISLCPELRLIYLDYRRILSVMPSFTVHMNVWSY